MYKATFRGEITFRQGASPSKTSIFDNWPANSPETNQVEDSVSFVINKISSLKKNQLHSGPILSIRTLG